MSILNRYYINQRDFQTGHGKLLFPMFQMVIVGLSWLFNSRCWKNHPGPEGVWSSGVIRCGIGRLLYRGGQGRWSKSGLWCSHSNGRKGPPVQNQVVCISRSNQPLLFLVARAAFNIVLTSRDTSGPSQGRREYTVGQYVVDLPSFENLALPLFRNVRCCRVLLEHINGSQLANSSPSTHLTNRQAFDSCRIDGIIVSSKTHKFQTGIFSVHGAVWLSLTVINPACKVSLEWRLHVCCEGTCDLAPCFLLSSRFQPPHNDCRF